jgi:hypothetical protein
VKYKRLERFASPWLNIFLENPVVPYDQSENLNCSCCPKHCSQLHCLHGCELFSTTPRHPEYSPQTNSDNKGKDIDDTDRAYDQPPFSAAVAEYPWWQPLLNDSSQELQLNLANCTVNCLRSLSSASSNPFTLNPMSQGMTSPGMGMAFSITGL